MNSLNFETGLRNRKSFTSFTPLLTLIHAQAYEIILGAFSSDSLNVSRGWVLRGDSESISESYSHSQPGVNRVARCDAQEPDDMTAVHSYYKARNTRFS